MLTIHHLGISQSERIIWLCEELGIPYDLIRYERDATTMLAPPEYKALHPLGTAPVITDGDLVLAESQAIVEYIARRYGGGALILGPEHRDFADYLFWFNFANGSLIPAFMMDLTAQHLGSAPITARSATGYALTERRLGEAEWFAGSEFTAADIMMGFTLTRLRVFSGQNLEQFPNARRYLAHVAARPAYQVAMARAEPEQSPLLT